MILRGQIKPFVVSSCFEASFNLFPDVLWIIYRQISSLQLLHPAFTRQPLRPALQVWCPVNHYWQVCVAMCGTIRIEELDTNSSVRPGCDAAAIVFSMINSVRWLGGQA